MISFLQYLNELSKEKMDKYIHKSFAHGNVLHKQIDKEPNPDKKAQLKHKLSVRNTGVIRAANKLTSTSESILNPADPHGDYKAKKKALQDLQLDRHTHKDSDLSREIQDRHKALDKEYAKIKEEAIDEMAGSGGMGGGSAGPTNVTGTQSATDPVSATAVNMKKKRKYPTFYRKSPK